MKWKKEKKERERRGKRERERLRWEKHGDKHGWEKGKLRWKKKKKKERGRCEIEREREFEIKKKGDRDRRVWVNFEMRKNRKIDVVRESGILRWEKKGRHVWWKRNIEMRKKKKGIDMGEREEINEKKNSINFSKFPATQLLTSITSTKFDVKQRFNLLQYYSSMWNKKLPIATKYLNVK